jgi:hypothetical protein
MTGNSIIRLGFIKSHGARFDRRAGRVVGDVTLTGNLYVQAVEAIYASGLDDELVPEALAATGGLLGASGATLEVIDKATLRPVEFYSAGLPAIAREQYFEQFAASAHPARSVPAARRSELGLQAVR